MPQTIREGVQKMQLPDSVQNILAYGQGYTDGMKDGHICGFHDALVCTIHDLTALLKKYAELEKEWAASQEKAKRERLENMPQFEKPAEHFCPNCGARMDATDTNVGGKGGAEND